LIKSRIVKWAGYVARMGERTAYGVWGGGGPEERIHYEDLGINWSTILTWILEK
jgi:hypothetical protein